MRTPNRDAAAESAHIAKCYARKPIAGGRCIGCDGTGTVMAVDWSGWVDCERCGGAGKEVAS